MGHRDPKNDAIWKLAARGVALWKDETAALARCAPGITPLLPRAQYGHPLVNTQASCRPNRLGYMPQGSLIISRDPGATALLQQRAAELSSEGIAADVLSPEQCTELEPLLHIPDTGAGLRVAGDFQIDARSASAYLLQCCEELGAARNRFRVRFGCTVGRIAMDCCTGGVSGVTTSRGDVIAECAL